MMKRVYELKRLLVPVAMGIVTLTVMGLDGRSVVQATDHEMNIVVTITDQGFKVKGHTTPDSLTSIVVHNKGALPHGITSPQFSAGVISKEGDGVEMRDSKGKGHTAYHLAPGKSMTLRFAKESHTDPATGMRETTQVPFWCDIHAHMRGEFLVVETRGEM
ncbi:MAG: hypothetical protein AABY96_14830 [Nitrospirota bacterium]